MVAIGTYPESAEREAATVTDGRAPQVCGPMVASGGADALTSFTVLWAIAALFHQAAYPERAFGLSSLFITLPALWVLLRPQATWRLLLLAGLQLAQVWRLGPSQVSNHWWFATAINMTLLASVAASVLGHRRRIDRTRLFATFAPVARIELVILYVFAVLHKLNTDFLDPVTSCAALQYRQIAERFAMLPTGTAVDVAAIYATLVIELAIPALLVVRRTRIAGAVTGLVFHLLLALNPHYVFFDFSSIVFACFFLFVPFDYWASLQQQQFRTPFGQRIRTIAGGGRAIRVARVTAAALIAFLLAAYLFRLVPSSDLATYVIRESVRLAFVVYAIGLMFMLHRVVQLGQLSAEVQGLARTTISPRWLWAMPVLLLLSGFSPYLGLKTEGSFSMFSNLRTEIGGNHLFIPSSLKIAGLQDDLVSIESSSVPALQRFAKSGALLTWFDFTVRAMHLPDAAVTYVRNGRRVVVPRLADAAGIDPPHWALRHLMAFRPVQPAGRQVACTH